MPEILITCGRILGEAFIGGLIMAAGMVGLGFLVWLVMFSAESFAP